MSGLGFPPGKFSNLWLQQGLYQRGKILSLLCRHCDTRPRKLLKKRGARPEARVIVSPGEA
jgi:hypothetical protein